MLQSTPSLPEQCITHREISESNFAAWKKSIIEYSRSDHNESLVGLISRRALTEQLRPTIRYVRVSSDGKYVLAQDENNIFVLTRSPFRFAFGIDAPEARPAQFTPDSRGIVFDATNKGSPRVERWDLPTQRRVEVHDIYVRDGCAQAAISPDGKVLACLSYRGTLQQFFGTPFFLRQQFLLILFDTATNAVISEKKNIWALPKFSPDGHYLLTHGRSDFCMDLTTRKEVRLPPSITELLSGGRFAFIGKDRLIAAASFLSTQAEVVEFPSGHYISKDIEVGMSELSPLAQEDYVLLTPTKDNPAGVMDLKQKKIICSTKQTALDVFDGKYIAERTDGDVQMFDLVTEIGGEQIQLPAAPLGYVRVAAVSPDLTYLAVSQMSRGAVWNLETGERLYHVKGFQGAYFSSYSMLYVDFPKYQKTNRSIARMSLKTSWLEPTHTFDEAETTRQVGRYLLTVAASSRQAHGSSHSASTGRDVSPTPSRVEVHDVTDQSLLWAKDFTVGLGTYWVSANTNSLILSWDATSKAFGLMAKQDAELGSRAARYPSREGILWLHVFDLDNGKSKGTLFIDTGKNSFLPIQADAVDNALIVSDNHKRVLVYSMSGESEGTIAGHSPVVSLQSQLMTVLTEHRTLELYELPSLRRRCVYEFDKPVSVVEFSQDGNRLLVLTTDQVAYTFDIKNP